MKFHFFANTAEGDVQKWLRHEALDGPFRRTEELVEAVGQATAVACGDILGCGHADASTEGTESFGAYMAVLAQAMPVSTKTCITTDGFPRLAAVRPATACGSS